ncbi:MAG: hypothetical protein J6K39_02865 [Clostridia bacterium]|nr:hypothetical protein [Clostridia bacterium]
MTQETLYEKICWYNYLYSIGNKKFLDRLMTYCDDFTKKFRKDLEVVSVRQVINYMAVCDFENKIHFDPQ